MLFQTQITRLKESVEKLQTECALLRTKEQTAQDAARRLQRALREAKEEAGSATTREHEATRAKRDLEKALESAEAETKIARDDLRLALQRIDDLQSAIQGELDLDCSEENTSDNSERYDMQLFITLAQMRKEANLLTIKFSLLFCLYDKWLE